MPKIERALLSLTDKSGAVDFARGLRELDIDLISTGGTAKLLKDAGIPVFDVSEVTHFPEMLDGRVKTIHPNIAGGILAMRSKPEHMEALEQHAIPTIDLVIVNLYAFEKIAADKHATVPELIENIDIGGPTMLRAAAKNHAWVGVIVNPADYERALKEMRENAGALSAATRFDLAVRTYEHTAAYDAAIANYLGRLVPASAADEPLPATFPRTFSTQFIKRQDMRYGENPHQKAAFYVERNPGEASVSTAVQLQGKELSYNNIADTDAALECVKSFSAPACVIVKHANPCGVAVAESITRAYELAFQTDPTSAFGGIIAFNRELDAATAQAIISRQFTEVIIAPSIAADALPVLATKQNVRVLSCGQWNAQPLAALDYKRVNGGLLVQDRDIHQLSAADLQLVSKRKPSEQELSDLLFAWKVATFVKSNAIVYCRNNQTIGIGAGQMSRVYSAKIAGIKAADEGLEVKGSVMASDAFFPFRDGIDAAAAAGITAVIHPGGSMRDDEIVAAADEHGIAMLFTGMRHFRH